MQYSLCEPECRSVLRIEGPPKHEGKGTLPWPSYEAGPRILPTYPETLSRKAKKHLESLGVEVFTNARVMSVDSDGILVDEQRVPTGTVLWGAGVVASPAGRWLGAETDKSVEISRHAFAYVFGGSGKFCNASAPLAVPTEPVGWMDTAPPTEVDNRSLVLFDRGDELEVQAGADGIRFLLVSGKPLEEPVAWYGPIVMNTQQQLRQAFEELERGTFLKQEA